MLEIDEVIWAIPKQGFKVLDTRDPSNALNEKTLGFMESRVQHKHFVD